MATWNEVKSFLTSGLNAKEANSGVLTMTLEYTDGRSQLVVVAGRVFKDAQWIDISSPVGTLSAGNINA